jgi:hypothetical protein
VLRSVTSTTTVHDGDVDAIGAANGARPTESCFAIS